VRIAKIFAKISYYVANAFVSLLLGDRIITDKLTRHGLFKSTIFYVVCRRP